jgi:hypothetical protein
MFAKLAKELAVVSKCKLLSQYEATKFLNQSHLVAVGGDPDHVVRI